MTTIYIVMKTVHSFDDDLPEETWVDAAFADENVADAYVEQLEKKSKMLCRLAEEMGALLACPSYDVVEMDVEGTEADIEDEDDCDEDNNNDL